MAKIVCDSCGYECGATMSEAKFMMSHTARCDACGVMGLRGELEDDDLLRCKFSHCNYATDDIEDMAMHEETCAEEGR